MSTGSNGKEDAPRPDAAGKTITVDVTSQPGMILVSGTDDMEDVAEIGKSMGGLFDAIAEVHGLPSGYALGPINRMCDGGCESTSDGADLPANWVHIDGLDYCATCRKTVEADGARPGAEPPIQSTPVSPVQGERHTQPEGESQMDDNNLNHLIGERDAEKWVDGFLTVVPDADRDLMLTWFACAIESGRMTVQGEHEQDGEARIYVTASEARLIGDAYFTGSPDALDRAHDVIARLADAADGRGESEPDGDTDA